MNYPPIQKLKKVERDLVEKYGELRLFGVFYREDSGKSPLVVSADWFGESPLENTRKINEAVQKHLNIDEIIEMGWIYAVEPNDRSVNEINNLVHTIGQEVVQRDLRFQGVDIPIAIIITSQASVSLNEKIAA